MRHLQHRIWALLSILWLPLFAPAATITVGPLGQYAMPCAGITAAQPGDVIEIDAAGSYTGDVCSINTSNLTIRGVNGRPHIDAGGNNAQGKGIWVVSGGDTLIENIEFSGAAVPSHNGAAIRQQGPNLTVRNCYIHDNEEGILTGADPNSAILIEYSEFARNGYGDGFTHNMYIGNVKQFTLQFSYSHQAKVGHLVKSRAATNYILYNRLTDETGSASFELDIPNGGLSYVVGNIIQQSPTTQNSNMAAYLEEGATAGNPSHALYMVNNTFVNSLGRGMFVFIAAADTTPALLENNFFSGGGAVTNQASAVLTTNFVGTPSFVNAAGYDYHLMAGSAGIDAGTAPGTGSGFSLMPADEYVHPTCGEIRRTSGIVDIGAFEYNGGGPILGCAINPVPPTLGSLSVNPSSLAGGTTTTGNTITLIGTAGSQGASIALASSDPHATVPAAVTVPAGESSAGFSIATSPVSAPTVVKISGTYRGQTVSTDLTIRPAPPALASVTLANTTIASGATLHANLVTLTAPAPTAGATILLQSGNPNVVSVPASVIVPAGANSATFSLTAGRVWQPTSVSVGASYAEKASQVFLTVQPAHVR
ncbi:MAG TPA: right-handed parallel beta-helix repeat-containing protein [Bryobacteraceae bacterium]